MSEAAATVEAGENTDEMFDGLCDEIVRLRDLIQAAIDDFGCDVPPLREALDG